MTGEKESHEQQFPKHTSARNGTRKCTQNGTQKVHTNTQNRYTKEKQKGYNKRYTKKMHQHIHKRVHKKVHKKGTHQNYDSKQKMPTVLRTETFTTVRRCASQRHHTLPPPAAKKKKKKPQEQHKTTESLIKIPIHSTADKLGNNLKKLKVCTLITVRAKHVTRHDDVERRVRKRHWGRHTGCNVLIACPRICHAVVSRHVHSVLCGRRKHEMNYGNTLGAHV